MRNFNRIAWRGFSNVFDTYAEYLIPWIKYTNFTQLICFSFENSIFLSIYSRPYLYFSFLYLVWKTRIVRRLCTQFSTRLNYTNLNREQSAMQAYLSADSPYQLKESIETDSKPSDCISITHQSIQTNSNWSSVMNQTLRGPSNDRYQAPSAWSLAGGCRLRQVSPQGSQFRVITCSCCKVFINVQLHP